MSKEFIVHFTEWAGRKDFFFCHARDEAHARAFAYWTLGDLIDITSVEEFIDG